MKMNTDDLIEGLANDLAPVRPLSRPERRAAGWLVGSILYFTLLAYVSLRFGSGVDGVDTRLLISQLIGVVAGVLAAVAAFASVIPGYSRRVLIWPAIATATWLAVFAYGALTAGSERAVVASQSEWFCVGVILIGGSPLVAALAVMLRRGAPLNPALTALLGALAVGLLANFGACVSRPHVEDAATLVWHGGAIVALALVCTAGARFVLRWRRR